MPRMVVLQAPADSFADDGPEHAEGSNHYARIWNWAVKLPDGKIRPRSEAIERLTQVALCHQNRTYRRHAVELLLERFAIRLEGAEEPWSATHKKEEGQELFVSRRLMNDDALITWAKENGIESPVGDMHVTVAHTESEISAEPLDNKIKIDGGERKVARLGDDGAIVLIFESGSLARRWQELIDAGATWDFDEYLPHVTIVYDPDKTIDEAKIKPYDGVLEFGPERFERTVEEKAAPGVRFVTIDGRVVPIRDDPGVGRSRQTITTHAGEISSGSVKIDVYRGGWAAGLFRASERNQARTALYNPKRDELVTGHQANWSEIAHSDLSFVMDSRLGKRLGQNHYEDESLHVYWFAARAGESVVDHFHLYPLDNETAYNAAFRFLEHYENGGGSPKTTVDFGRGKFFGGASTSTTVGEFLHPKKEWNDWILQDSVEKVGWTDEARAAALEARRARMSVRTPPEKRDLGEKGDKSLRRAFERFRGEYSVRMADKLGEKHDSFAPGEAAVNKTVFKKLVDSGISEKAAWAMSVAMVSWSQGGGEPGMKKFLDSPDGKKYQVAMFDALSEHIGQGGFTLYRAVSSLEHGKIDAAVEGGKTSANVRSSRMSSWTVDPRVAIRASQLGMSTEGEPLVSRRDARKYVVAAKVKLSDVAFTSLWGPAWDMDYIDEKEIVLKPGKVRAALLGSRHYGGSGKGLDDVEIEISDDAEFASWRVNGESLAADLKDDEEETGEETYQEIQDKQIEPAEVSVFLDRLAAMAREAEEKGEAAPTFDLGKVHVEGTNPFLDDTVGLPRAEMPQLRAEPEPGSIASLLPKMPYEDDKEDVDIGPFFLVHLMSSGVGVEDTTEDVTKLKATQRDLDGVKVSKIMEQMKSSSDDGKDLRESPLFVSRDNYIVDGHHRWAAMVGLEYEDGKDDQDIQVSVHRVDMDILSLVDEANEFADLIGMPHVKSIEDLVEKGTYDTPSARRVLGHYAAGRITAQQAANRIGGRAQPEKIHHYAQQAGHAISSRVEQAHQEARRTGGYGGGGEPIGYFRAGGVVHPIFAPGGRGGAPFAARDPRTRGEERVSAGRAGMGREVTAQMVEANKSTVGRLRDYVSGAEAKFDAEVRKGVPEERALQHMRDDFKKEYEMIGQGHASVVYGLNDDLVVKVTDRIGVTEHKRVADAAKKAGVADLIAENVPLSDHVVIQARGRLVKEGEMPEGSLAVRMQTEAGRRLYEAGITDLKRINWMWVDGKKRLVDGWLRTDPWIGEIRRGAEWGGARKSVDGVDWDDPDGVMMAWDFLTDETEMDDLEEKRWVTIPGRGPINIGGDEPSMPRQSYRDPPAPRGRFGEAKAGGYSRAGMTNTELGNIGETIAKRFGLEGLHYDVSTGTARLSPLDVVHKSSGYAFEVKTLSTHAAEYKVKMKAHEVAEKIAYARNSGLKPATMMVIYDKPTKSSWTYWRPGIGNYRLDSNWNFLGKRRVY